MLHFFSGCCLRYTLGELKQVIELQDSGFQSQQLELEFSVSQIN